MPQAPAIAPVRYGSWPMSHSYWPTWTDPYYNFPIANLHNKYSISPNEDHMHQSLQIQPSGKYYLCHFETVHDFHQGTSYWTLWTPIWPCDGLQHSNPGWLSSNKSICLMWTYPGRSWGTGAKTIKHTRRSIFWFGNGGLKPILARFWSLCKII